jgi:hypothetical protein
MGKCGRWAGVLHFFIDYGASIGKWAIPGVLDRKKLSDPDHRELWHQG